MAQLCELMLRVAESLAALRRTGVSILNEAEERELLVDVKFSLVRILLKRLVDCDSDTLRALQANDNGIPGMFQVYAFCTRIGKLLAAEDEVMALRATDPARPVVMLCERSIYTDRDVFKHMGVQNGFITDIQSQYYEGCFAVWQRVAARFAPDMCVFVDTGVADGMARIAERARAGEDVSVGYETALWARHNELFVQQKKFAGAPIVVVDGGRNFRSCEHTAEEIARELLTAGSFCEVSA
jgi:hypothetical protein